MPRTRSPYSGHNGRHRLTIGTRYVEDFEPTGIDLLNPWVPSC